MPKEFDFSEFEKFADNWKKMDKAFLEFFKKFLLQMALRIVGLTKDRQSGHLGEASKAVDTGAMLNMWGVGRTLMVTAATPAEAVVINPENATIDVVEVTGNDVTIEIWNGMEYATFPEYGTRFITPRYMFTFSLNEIQQQMPLRFEKQFKEFLQSYGVG